MSVARVRLEDVDTCEQIDAADEEAQPRAPIDGRKDDPPPALADTPSCAPALLRLPG
jgi:hypothetical protein